MLALFFAALLVGVPVWMAAAWIRERSRVARDVGERAAALVPARFDPDVPPGTVVCVRGTLAGAPGARIVAWSGLPAPEPPVGLEVEVDGTRLALAGRTAVLVGSRESSPALAGTLAARLRVEVADGFDPSAVRSIQILRVGDRVVVRGKLARAATEGGTYRAPSAALALEAFDARGVLDLAAEGSPRVVGRSLASRAWPLALLGPVLFWSLGSLGRHEPPPTPIAPDRVLPPPVQSFPVAVPFVCNAAVDALFDTGQLLDVAVAGSQVLESASSRCALRVAESSLAAHRYHVAARAVRRYEQLLPGHDRMEDDRREALLCIADALAARNGGNEFADDKPDDTAAGRLRAHASSRAICKLLDADARPVAERPASFGDLDWVWGDTQGMQFAKSGSRQIAAMMLAEAGPRYVEPGEGRYTFYPDAFLAKNLPTTRWPSAGIFDEGDDVATMEWSTRTGLEGKPYAMFAALEKAGRPGRNEDADFRMDVLGNLALFLAATGDVPGARAVAKKLADIPDARSNAPKWTRPTVNMITKAIDELDAGAEPVPMHGELLGALVAAVARVRGGDAPSASIAGRYRAALLDRSIALPLYFLETYARR